MLQRPEPVRFTFELHGDPTRGWVLGFVDPSGNRTEVSVEQLNVRRQPPSTALPAIWPSEAYREPASYLGDCDCPGDCLRDHPNE